MAQQLPDVRTVLARSVDAIEEGYAQTVDEVRFGIEYTAAEIERGLASNENIRQEVAQRCKNLKARIKEEEKEEERARKERERPSPLLLDCSDDNQNEDMSFIFRLNQDLLSPVSRSMSRMSRTSRGSQYSHYSRLSKMSRSSSRSSKVKGLMAAIPAIKPQEHKNTPAPGLELYILELETSAIDLPEPSLRVPLNEMCRQNVTRVANKHLCSNMPGLFPYLEPSLPKNKRKEGKKNIASKKR